MSEPGASRGRPRRGGTGGDTRRGAAGGDTDALALVLTPLGTLGYFGYCRVRWGDPLAYEKTRAAGWGAITLSPDR